MKTMLFAAAALVLATPAFAQSYDPSVGSGNLVQSQASRPGVYMQYALQSAEGACARFRAARMCAGRGSSSSRRSPCTTSTAT